MSYSPYESPKSESFPSKFAGAPDRENLRAVAKYQRWVMYSLLANLAVNIAFFATGALDPIIRALMLIPMLAIAGFSIVSVALLASRLMNTAVAVLCGILVLFPCISLITLLIVNQKATTYLQQHGVKVGFLGANPNTI
jgi:hypothetical protein